MQGCSRCEGSFDEALDAARELAAQGTHVLVNSLNPYRLEGQKTAAFEIVEELGAPPDVLALPYGGGGNTCAYAKGFAEWGAGMPRLLAVRGGATARGHVASAIRIAEPVHAADVDEAIERSGGAVVTVSDDAILERLACARARGRGLLRAGSAAALAGSRHPARAGHTVVCVITGHGLKDPETAVRESAATAVYADRESIAEAAA